MIIKRTKFQDIVDAQSVIIKAIEILFSFKYCNYDVLYTKCYKKVLKLIATVERWGDYLSNRSIETQA